MRRVRFTLKLSTFAVAAALGMRPSGDPLWARGWSHPARNISSEGNHVRYRVKRDDTIGELLCLMGIGPLWGPGRAVEDTLRLNQGKVRANGSFMQVGDLIDLPVTSLPAAPQYHVDEEGIAAIVAEAKCTREGVKLVEVATTTPAPVKATRAPAAIVAEPTETPTAPIVIPEVLTPVATAPSLAAPAAPIPIAAPAFSPASALAPEPVSAPASTPAPVAVQPASVATQERDEYPTYSRLTFRPRFSFAAIKSTDAATGGQALLLSNLSPLIETEWRLFWSPKWQSFVRIGAAQVSYDAGPDFSITGDKTSLYGFTGGATYELSSSLSLSGFIGMQQSAFIRSSGPTGLAVEAQPVPELGVEAVDSLVRVRSLSLEGVVGLMLLGPVSAQKYTISSGIESYARIRMKQKIGASCSASAGMFGDYASQKLSIATQTKLEVGAELGFSFDIGAEK